MNDFDFWCRLEVLKTERDAMKANNEISPGRYGPEEFFHLSAQMEALLNEWKNKYKDVTRLGNNMKRQQSSDTFAYCSVCAGTGQPQSGKPCICGGAGTAVAEAQALREILYDVERERDDAVTRLESVMSELWEGVRVHGIWAPKTGRDGERLIHAYCGAIVERDIEIERLRKISRIVPDDKQEDGE